MKRLKNIIRRTLSEAEMGDHWFEASVVSEMKSLGFEGDGKHVDENDMTHFIFTKDFPDGEGIFSAVITKGTFGFMVLLKAYSTVNDKKKVLFQGTMKEPSELSKIEAIMKEYIEEIRLVKLGIKHKKPESFSRKEIDVMIDRALDKNDFEEVERLSKLL